MTIPLTNQQTPSRLKARKDVRTKKELVRCVRPRTAFLQRTSSNKPISIRNTITYLSQQTVPDLCHTMSKSVELLPLAVVVVLEHGTPARGQTDQVFIQDTAAQTAVSLVRLKYIVLFDK